MSGTAPSPTVRDQVIAEARSLPDLIAKAQTADPQLAAQLSTKAAVASKTMWGTVASLVVSWAVTKWSLGWDPNTCALVSGVIAMGVGAVVRRFTDPRVTGFLKAS
jgi:hypothetical protein